MKYYTRLKLYKSNNNVVDLENTTAHSYGHWQYLRKVNGRTIFNQTRYSQSTCKHQRECYDLLNYQADLVLRHTLESLSNPVSALISEVKGIEYEIAELERAMAKPRSHGRKNYERQREIDEHLVQIDHINAIIPKIAAA